MSRYSARIRVCRALLFLAFSIACASETWAQDAGPVPTLPVTPYDYVAYAETNLPEYYSSPQSPFGAVATADNTPLGNPLTNAGATLGRVLFYDRRLSIDNTVRCASCHKQEHGFSEPRRFSPGVNGQQTSRNSPGLTNSKYYATGKMFWDERAASLEEQALIPIQSPVEMGLDLATLVSRLEATSFYPELFHAAFGDPAITPERIAKAIAQFERTLVSYESKHDAALSLSVGLPPGYLAADVFRLVYTDHEMLGMALFQPVDGKDDGDETFVIGGQSYFYQNLRSHSAKCNQCHQTSAQILGAAGGAANGAAGPFAANTGLDAETTDFGANGIGAFKSPSLRNIEVTGPFMHDGRFETLQEVIEFYSTGIQDNIWLHEFLRENDDSNGAPKAFNFEPHEIVALVAFLRTLTDKRFLTNEIFTDPFAVLISADFNEDGKVNGFDFLIWQNGFGSNDALRRDGDADGDGDVDGADFLVWQTEFSDSPLGIGAGAAVPGPMAAVASVGVALGEIARLKGKPKPTIARKR